ncbi:MAG: two-component system sensor histidine kinase NtrB [Anaerolineaceae bacterium]|jgi:two-component system sensor histidine kinase AtoS
MPPENYQPELKLLDQTPILDLLPFAAVLYDRSSDQLLHANEAYYELTGFTSANIETFSLNHIVAGELDTNPTEDSSRTVRLKLASGDVIFYSIRITSVSLNNQIVVLAFPKPDSGTDLRDDLIEQEIQFDNLSQLTALGFQTSVRDLIECSKGIVNRLVKPKFLSFYLVEPKEKNLRRVHSTDDPSNLLFPSTVSKEVLDAIPTQFLWRSTKKTVNVFHEVALVNGMGYVLMMPLYFNGNGLGCIVCSGIGNGPGEEVLRYMTLLSSYTAATLHHVQALEQARKTIQRIRQVVQIQHAITDNLEEGIIILTPDLRIAEMSPSAEIMLGYASNEVFLQKAELVLIGNETLSTMYKSAQEGISTLVGDNLSLNMRNGKSFLAQVLCIPVLTDNQVSSIVLILRDLSQTEQIRARTQQLEQRAFLGEVSAIFAHEVKNPINNLYTGLQYMGMTLKPDEPHFELVNRMQNDCLRLTHLMDSTLTFSKAIEYHFEPLDLGTLIPLILDRWGPRMTRLNIKYNFEANPEHPMVSADSRALEQVFVNLISNAIQAMDNLGGMLNIRILPAENHENPPQYEVIVADSGPGIPQDLLDHIFEPFITSNTSGTGLGLAITKRIVTAHKGNIFVESYPGGTMFHILLPKAE